MALIEVFHVVASEILCDPTDNTDIPQGSIVTLDANGLVTIQVAVANTEPRPIGIAGDSRSQGTTSYTPESGSALATATEPLKGALVIGSQSAQQFTAQRYTQNRVADNYNEVLASGKMTVYHSGGEFWTDQYEEDDVWVCGHMVFSSATTPGLCSMTETADHLIGQVLNTPTEYPSGVPGTETNFTALPEGGNSLTWGNFLHIKLLI